MKKRRSLLGTLFRTLVVPFLLGCLLYVGAKWVKDQAKAYAAAKTAASAVVVETPQETVYRNVHAQCPSYDLSVLDDGKLRCLNVGSPDGPTIVLHGSKVVFRNDADVNPICILTDQLTGERSYFWDRESNTLLDADGKVCFHYDPDDRSLELGATKYGDLLELFYMERVMNQWFADAYSLCAVIDLTTGEELPLPEDAHGFTATADRLLFSCFDTEETEKRLVVQDRAGNTLYTMENCLETDVTFFGANAERYGTDALAPWVCVRRWQTEGESETLWLDPVTREERDELPVDMPTVEGVKNVQSNGGYTAWFMADGSVWVQDQEANALCGKVCLSRSIAEQDLRFLTWTEDGRAVFSTKNETFHSTEVVDNNGQILMTNIDTYVEDDPLPAGVFKARNAYGTGWLDVNGNWVYFEEYTG